MKLFKIGKTLICHIMGKIVKNRAKLYLSCNCFFTLYFLAKVKVRLKNCQTLASLNLNYGTTKQKPKIKRLQKW